VDAGEFEFVCWGAAADVALANTLLALAEAWLSTLEMLAWMLLAAPLAEVADASCWEASEEREERTDEREAESWDATEETEAEAWDAEEEREATSWETLDWTEEMAALALETTEEGGGASPFCADLHTALPAFRAF
jgi:hypothetical protein